MSQGPAPSADPGLRPLGTAELLDGAVRLVRHNVRAVLAVSVPVAVVSTLLVTLLNLARISSSDATFGTLLGGVLTTQWAGTVHTGLLTPVFTAALLGGRTTARAALTRPLRAVAILLVLGLLIGVAEVVGLVLLIVGGVWLWGLWAVAAPACTSEQLGVFAALRRSQRLTGRLFWRVWGIRALGWVVTSVLALFVMLPFDSLAVALSGGNFVTRTGIDDARLFVVITAVGTLISGAIIAPVSAAIDVLLYTDLRIRREGLDIALGLPTRPDAPATVTAW